MPIIEVLRKNFDLSLVLTTERLALQGEVMQSPVINLCIKSKIPYLSAQQFSNLIVQQLKKPKASVAVLADFGLIIPPEILSLFPKGIVNVHPSLLPKYRGSTPVQAAILNGDKTTGVSIMKLDGKIDHGPILKQEKEKILDTDTAETLYERLFAKGANLLPKVLNKYFKGNLKPIPQNHTKATITKPLTRQDGFIDVSKLATAVTKIDTMIRAYYPWPGVWTQLRIRDKLLRIKFLPGQKLQVEGKKPISYQDFLNGYPEAKELVSSLLSLID